MAARSQANRCPGSYIPDGARELRSHPNAAEWDKDDLKVVIVLSSGTYGSVSIDA